VVQAFQEARAGHSEIRGFLLQLQGACLSPSGTLERPPVGFVVALVARRGIAGQEARRFLLPLGPEPLPVA
jgi:hypothetical protein